MKNTELFSSRAEFYVRYRPHYPAEIISFLKEAIGLQKNWKIADIGSGTGISTELFLKNGNELFAVEPNREMREFAEKMFKGNSLFHSINATAEDTTLPEKTMDLLMASQAFHWFDRGAAKREFQRIAKPNAQLVLIWNIRDPDCQFQQGYDEMLTQYAPGFLDVSHRNANEQMIREFFAPEVVKIHEFPNFQKLNYEELEGRLLSTSYVPLESDPNHKLILNRLKYLFDKFNVDGQITFNYICKLYYGTIGV